MSARRGFFLIRLSPTRTSRGRGNLLTLISKSASFAFQTIHPSLLELVSRRLQHQHADHTKSFISTCKRIRGRSPPTPTLPHHQLLHPNRSPRRPRRRLIRIPWQIRTRHISPRQRRGSRMLAPLCTRRIIPHPIVALSNLLILTKMLLVSATLTTTCTRRRPRRRLITKSHLPLMPLAVFVVEFSPAVPAKPEWCLAGIAHHCRPWRRA